MVSTILALGSTESSHTSTQAPRVRLPLALVIEHECHLTHTAQLLTPTHAWLCCCLRSVQPPGRLSASLWRRASVELPLSCRQI